MDDCERQSDFDIRGLSLIDVCSEDDCLLYSPVCSPKSSGKAKGRETKHVRFSMDPNIVEVSLGSLEEEEKLEEPHDSLEQDKPRKNGKYNLRKSLAWDSAFFTSAGVLDPEELSTMLGGNEKGETHTLPGIEEDVNKSCDSSTTLDGETLTLGNVEADLFEDIRASIQKSNKVSNTANSSDKKELKTMDSRIVSSSKKVELTTQAKKAAPKKPIFAVKDTGKTLQQTVQSVARSRESTSSLHKPPKVLSCAGPSTIPTKRVSLGGKNVKMEKDTKSVTGRGTTLLKTPALYGAKNILPRPKLSSKSSSCSPASSTTELRTSCSSLESCASASSDNINKSSLNLMNLKNESRRPNSSSSDSTITTPSKIAPKGKNLAGSSKLSTILKSSTKLSSSISPASSISEWSSESSSSTSTVNQRSNTVRASLSTGSRNGSPTNCDAQKVLDSQNQPTGAGVTGSLNDGIGIASAGTSFGTGGLLHPASMKPSGLRMPSPKIGFFDGVRSSGRTPTGSMLSHRGLPSGLPKNGAKSTSPSGNSNKAKTGNLLLVRAATAIQSPKVDVKQTFSAVKPRSSLSIKKSPNVAAKVSSASRNPKSSPGLSPKLQNKSSPEKVVGKDGARVKDTEIIPLDGVPGTNDDSTANADVQNTFASKDPIEDQISCLVRNGGAMEVDISSDAQKEPIADSHVALAHKEIENSLSNPTPISPGSRIPFSPKDSFYNMDAPVEVLQGPKVAVDKTTTLLVPESILPENS
ncbi:hypothetical protein PTKIN_Ptkin13bG0271600 [Pterospermum kingtungense]